MSEVAKIEALIRAALPIEHGDRIVRVGRETPLVGDGGIAVEIAGHDARVAPCTRLGDGSAAIVAAWLDAIRLAVRSTAGRWCFAALDTKMPLDVDPVVMRKPQWLGHIMDAADRLPYSFEPAPPSVAYQDDDSLDAHAIEHWCARQWIEGESMPAPAQTLVDLMHFYGQVYNGGMASFLLQRTGAQIVTAYRGLVELGSHKLAERLASGIEPATRGYPEFQDFVFPDDMTRGAPAPSLEALDGHEYPGSWYLIERELAPARTRFIRRHVAVLVRS